MNYTASETQQTLEQIRENTTADPLGIYDTLDEAMRLVVEDGTFTPDAKLVAGLSLTPYERLFGVRTQDVTAVFCLGLMLGGALERDIPSYTEREEAWRDGEFVLPEAGR